MTEQIVKEWLADYAALSPAEIHSFAVSVQLNREVITAIYNVLEERHKYQSVGYVYKFSSLKFMPMAIS